MYGKSNMTWTTFMCRAKGLVHTDKWNPENIGQIREYTFIDRTNIDNLYDDITHNYNS